METVAAIFFVILVLVCALCAFFLLVVQPIWGIVDVAVSNEHSGATKAIVIILTLLLLGPLMTFIYACFITRSSVLRRFTLIAFGLLIAMGVLAIGVAIAVPAIKHLWEKKTGVVAEAGLPRAVDCEVCLQPSQADGRHQVKRLEPARQIPGRPIASPSLRHHSPPALSDYLLPTRLI
jgi:hypothetical protein